MPNVVDVAYRGTYDHSIFTTANIWTTNEWSIELESDTSLNTFRIFISTVDLQLTEYSGPQI